MELQFQKYRIEYIMSECGSNGNENITITGFQIF